MTLASRLAIAMILLVAVAVSAVGWLSYHALEQALLPRVLDRIEGHSRLLAAELEAYVQGARADIATFRANGALRGIVAARFNGGVDPDDHLTEAAWRQRLLVPLIAELEAKPNYAKFRIIETDGVEMLRVDRSGPNGAVRVVPNERLQNKAERSFFQEAVKLADDQIYVSPLDLNVDDGVIQTPHVPTLRVAGAIFGPNRQPFGIVVINIDMRDAFSHVRASMRTGEQVYVVGDNGDYLVHPDPSREFGSQLGRPTRWQDDFPYFASIVDTAGSASQIVTSPAGKPGGVALSSAILAGTKWAGVIQVAPNATFMAPAAAIQHTSLAIGLIAVLVAAVLAVLLARTLTRPIGQLTAAVEAIGHDDAVVIPTEAPGETGVLARAFAQAIEETRAKTAALEREILDHRRTEAARDHHAAREHLFSTAVESSDDAIVTQSLDAVITGWNRAAERLYGYSAEEAVGQPTSIIMPPERRKEAEDNLRRIARGERIEHFETTRRRKDGSPIEISVSLSPIRSPSGEIIGASGFARSLTEARRTERALQQQLEERRQIFDTSQDLIMIMNSRGWIVQISPSCETILGYRPDEVVGRGADEFTHPDHLEGARAEMRALRRGEQPKIADTRALHKDGREVWLSWLGAWSEQARRYFYVGRDMTEARRAQESLRESERLARNIIETALDAFVQTDEKGGILNLNSRAETMFGWPRDEALGKDALDLLIGDADRETERNSLRRFTDSRQGGGRRREVMARRRDGKEFRAELSVTGLRRREGLVFNAFFRDLTDKIAAEERIRHTEKMEAIGQLTGGVAHDFNNILTVITGTIEILADAVAKEPQLAAITRMIDEAAARGADLTQHLLAFARKQPLQPRETDVNTLIVDTAKLLRPTLGEHVQIETVFENEASVAIVDPNQLTTALLNLALNARDAMPGGGKLILETGFVHLDEAYASANDVRPGHYVLIAVSDTGSGIAANVLDRVFDPFFTSKGPGKGTGLGLSMVYGFIRQSAGHIRIYSEEGHGTSIKMYLPPGNAAAAGAGDGVAPATVASGHETILVVEDDRLVRDYVLAQLRSLGYVTLEAADAAEAMAIVASGKPFDLLFTDVIMPGRMNGRQLADELQKTRPGLKVVYTSGYTENAIIHHGRLDSGVLLLAKPYRKSELAKILRKALDG
ncbi:PAS domain S-box protein [Bradyrhizobium sp.]|uniref:PAS domain S-box protein n=1 Tax=Bradyrhizobium sp. TaxID=376 RepID=UPI0023943609|nr:PAS domain S-box protein [Bradyrhizobium sp.]MDE2376915.1 PAS domain S-box protein [Bradyrhizobium sp.]